MEEKNFCPQCGAPLTSEEGTCPACGFSFALKDPDMREPLFDYLDDRYGKIRTIEEKIISGSRADVLGITDGRILGFEIKSDRDTYSRLKTQVKDYEKFCDACWIVAGEKHEKHVAEHVPDYWGILIMRRDTSIYEMRPAGESPHVRLEDQLSLLWRRELSAVQEKEGIPRYAGRKRSFVYERLIHKVDREDLKRDITDQLFERDYTIFDKPKPRQSRGAARKRAHVTHYIGHRKSRGRRRRT